MNLKFISAALVSALLVLSGCGGGSTSTSGGSGGGGGSGSGGNGPSNAYFKLTQGDTWTYSNTYIINPQSTTPITTLSTVVTTVGTTTAGSTTVTKSITPQGGSATSTNLTYSFDANNNLLVSGSTGNAQAIPATPTVGNSWSILQMTYTITSVSASITATAGSYTNCLQITESGIDPVSGSNVVTQSYYSSTTGNLVYASTTGTSSGGTPFTVVRNLTNYTLF